ncbi:heart- and neural crest derivatives-expressed protein 2-like [Panulirus ornatus]|uniref:heart- and neural crest derivatives-expressed protein 2-like n=1 Tax=Panulirus ornatus TaxID=150431 RepID=UPI003A836593
MSLVGGYSMPQSYGHAAMGAAPSPEALYSSYYSHPSPPGQALYPGWGYTPAGYSPGYSPEVAVACQEFGVSGGFVVGPGSPHDLASGDYTIEMVDGCGRVVKRRSSANKKERRRTQSINNAFAELRECIPNVPADTKLSKIKTLRLATSYIAYLMEVLHAEDAAVAVAPPTNAPAASAPPAPPPETFRADLPPRTRPTNAAHHPPDQDKVSNTAPSPATTSPEAKRGRTGWPQEVWAQELKK